MSLSKIPIRVDKLRLDGVLDDRVEKITSTGVADIYKLLSNNPFRDHCRSSFHLFVTIYKGLTNLFQAAAFEDTAKTPLLLVEGLTQLLGPSWQRLRAFLSQPSSVAVEEVLLHCHLLAKVIQATRLVRPTETVSQATYQVVSSNWDVMQGLITSFDDLPTAKARYDLAEALAGLMQQTILAGDIPTEPAVLILQFAERVNRVFHLATSLKLMNLVICRVEMNQNVVYDLSCSLIEVAFIDTQSHGFAEAMLIPEYASALFNVLRSVAVFYHGCLAMGFQQSQFSMREMGIGCTLSFMATVEGNDFKICSSYWFHTLYSRKAADECEACCSVFGERCTTDQAGFS